MLVAAVDCRAVILAALLLPLPLAAEPYYTIRAAGWFWYQEPPLPPEQEELQQQQPATDHKQQLLVFQEELEQSLARAVLQPRPEHVRHYMQLNQQSLALAGEFANVWQYVLRHQPELDYRLQYPTADQALQSFNIHGARMRDKYLRQLATEYGLWFVFRSDCPVCHRFAPVLRGFADSYGFTVLAVSLDGGSLPEFPRPRLDQGVTAMLEVDLVPALFLVAPRQRSFNIIGYGYMSSELLAQRLLQAGEQRPIQYGDGN